MIRNRPLDDYKAKSSGVVFAEHLEWIEASKWAGVPWHIFETLDGEEQSFIVASYETSTKIEAVLQELAEKDAKRNTKGKK